MDNIELYCKIEKTEDIDDVKNVLFNIAKRIDCLERVIMDRGKKMTRIENHLDRLDKDPSITIKIQKE